MKKVVILFIGVSLFIFFLGRKEEENPYKRTQAYYDELIAKMSLRHNIDPCLLRAVITQESRFNPNAKGDAGEIGLMQITLPVVKDWERALKRDFVSPNKSLFDPEINLEIGSWYLGKALREWHNHHNTIALALIQYNAGRSRAIKWEKNLREPSFLQHIPFPSTKVYVENVLEYHHQCIAKLIKSSEFE